MCNLNLLAGIKVVVVIIVVLCQQTCVNFNKVTLKWSLLKYHLVVEQVCHNWINHEDSCMNLEC